MLISTMEQTFIQSTSAENFPSFFISVWKAWPALTYTQARKKAAILLKRRTQWVKNLEPTERICKTCYSSLHTQWHNPDARIRLNLDSGLREAEMMEPYEMPPYPPLPASPKSCD